MKHVISVLVVFTFLSFRALAGAGVAAGNLAGESSETADGAGPAFATLVTPPPPPVVTQATRLDRKRVLVKWQAPSGFTPRNPVSTFVVFRAKNADPWDPLVELRTATEWTDPDAEAGSRYRYVVATRSRIPTSRQVKDSIRLYGPASDKVVDDVRVRLVAGVARTQPSLPQGVASGTISVGPFAPDETTANTAPQDPVQYTGPFTTEEVTPYSGTRYGEKYGWLPKGKPITQNVDITGTGLAAGTDYLFAGVTFAAATVPASLPPLTYTGAGQSVQHVSGQATFTIPQGDFTGTVDPLFGGGFDGVSNPKALAIGGLSGNNSVKMTVSPTVENTRLSLSQDEHLQVAGTPANGATLTVSSGNGSKGTFRLQSYVDSSTLAGLDVDVLDMIDQHVLIAVVRPQFDPTAPAITEAPMPSNYTTLPNLSALREKFQALYEKQAGIRVQVDLLTSTYYRFRYNEDTSGQILNYGVLNTYNEIEMLKFASLAKYILDRKTYYQRVMFIVDAGLSSVEGQAGGYGSTFAVLRVNMDANTYCHEYGHMLSAHHPWNDNKPDEPIPANSQETIPGPLPGRIMGYNGGFNLIKIEWVTMRDYLNPNKNK